MQLKIYRIDDSISGSVFRFFRGPDLPPTAATSGFFGSMARNWNDYNLNENIYVINSKEELNRFKNALGNSWVSDNQYYVRHPKDEKTSYLIEADKFLSYIEQERIEEIIAFIRQNCPNCKHIVVESLTKAGFEFSAGGRVKFSVGEENSDGPEVGSINIGANAKGSIISANKIDITCSKKIPLEKQRKNFLWIDECKTLMAAIDAGDKFSIRQSLSCDWGIDANVAVEIRMIELSSKASFGQSSYYELKIDVE